MLGVSLRTIGHWETGATRVPYAAFKLLRVYRKGDLLHPAWEGYNIVRGKLVTPENHELCPADMSWLSLLSTRARHMDQAVDRARALDAELRRVVASRVPAPPVAAGVEPGTTEEGPAFPSHASTGIGRAGGQQASLAGATPVGLGSLSLTPEVRPQHSISSASQRRAASAQAVQP